MTHVPVFGPNGGVPGQPGQQQQPHPTVPYGQNVQQPVPIPNQPQVGQPQQFAQPAPQPAPQPTQQQIPVYGGVPQQQTSTFPPGTNAPWQRPQVPQQQPPQQQIPDNLVFDGPTVPPELRGRTWAQIRGAYTTMASEFFNQPGRVPAPRPNNVAATPQPAQPTQQQTQTQGQRPASFWEDPEGAISRVVDQRLAPITQRSIEDGIRSAHEQAKQTIPDFAALEPDLMNVMRGAPNAEMLTDPEFWRSTARLVRGKLVEEGRYQPNASQQQQPNQQPQQQNGNYQQPQNRGPGVFQPAGAFFTEAPTAPNPQFNSGNFGVQQYELTPQQKEVAAKMNMSEQEYRDWSVGFQQNSQTRRW